MQPSGGPARRLGTLTGVVLAGPHEAPLDVALARMNDAYETLIARLPGDERKRSLRLWVDATVQTYALPDATRCVIGRGSDTGLMVNHPTVSRRHAEIVVERRSLTLVDLGSTNGTRIHVDALAPNQAQDLGIGQVFLVGDVAGVVWDASADARPSRSVGRAEITAAIERAASRAIELGAFSVVAFTCADLAAHLEPIAALTPPRVTLRRSGKMASSRCCPA